MSTLTVELPDTPEIREGDEVTIRARMTGSRLVAETVRRLHAQPAADAGDESASKRAAFDAFVREWSGAGKTPMTDAEIRAGYIAKQLAKHCK